MLRQRTVAFEGVIGAEEERGTRCTANYNTPYSLVDSLEATRLKEPLRRLQTRLDGVDREEQQVDGRAGQTTCLPRYVTAYCVLTTWLLTASEW